MLQIPTIVLLSAAALAAAPPKPLTILKPALHQYEDGPALEPKTGFVAGDFVFLSFRVGGYQMTEERDVSLSYRIDALDPKGAPLVEPVRQEIKTTLSPQDKDWTPIVRQSFPLPPLALPGEYRVAITVEDKLDSREAKAEMAFAVRGRNVELSDTLAIRSFRFQRSEEDSQTLDPPVYRAGEAVWARFDIVGYKLGEKNRLQVSYGVTALSPAGKTMYSQPQAAAEQGESFYPKRYLPGVFSLNLSKDMRPGAYAIVLTVRDEMGGQNLELKQEFRVE